MSATGRRRERATGVPVQYRAVAGAVAGIAAFLGLAPLVDNRLLQIFMSLAIGLAVWKTHELWLFYRHAWSSGKGTSKQPVLLIAASMIFCAITLWGLLSNLLDPQYGVSRYEYVPVAAAAAAVAFLMPAIFSAATGAAAYLTPRKATRIIVLAVVFAAFFAVQVYIGSAVRIAPSWDVGAVIGSAMGLATDTSEHLGEGYFSQYPNNIMLTLVLSRYFDFVMLFGVTDFVHAAVVLNCIVLTLGALLTYAVARRIGGEAAALFTLLPSFIFLVLSPWIMVVYSDTLGLLFPILLFYLYLLQADRKTVAQRVLIWVAMGVAAVIGYNIKPTAVFVLLAIAAVSVLTVVLRRPTRKALLSMFVGAAVVTGSYVGASHALTAVENASGTLTFDLRTNEKAFPLTHFLKMGAQANGGVYNPFYGSFHQPDVVETAETAPNMRLETNFHAYTERVKEMGTSGYVTFLSDKLAWFLGDGSFFLWGEGTVENQPFLAGDPASRSIQSYYGFEEENYGSLIGLWQAAWFLLLGLVALPLFHRTPSLFTRPATILRVALLGLFVFLLFFEARARYLYLYLPFFVLLASLSASALSGRGAGSTARTVEPDTESVSGPEDKPKAADLSPAPSYTSLTPHPGRHA